MSTKISVLTHEHFFKRGFSDLYPIRKWKKELHNNGYKINFYYYHKSKEILSADVLLLHHRYYAQIIKGYYSPIGFKSKDLNFIFELLVHAKSRGLKIILFESGDAGGTKTSEILPYVDICLKKQVFVDKARYARIEGDRQIQVWLPRSINGDHEIRQITPVADNDLKKIQVGWNIGLNDYRYFPQIIKKYYPLNTYTLSPRIYDYTSYQSPLLNKNLIFSYRGKKRGNLRYSYNREQLINVINNELSYIKGKYNIGGKVSFKKYMFELLQSKVGLSPFGWGELCYRDFEIMISGALLIKPSVSHLETYPNYFIENETYIPTRWDHEDLPTIISNVDKNYSDYLHIAKKAQEKFQYFNNSAQEFVEHFNSIISKL